MNTTQKILAATLGLALAGAAAAETIVLSEPEVRTIVTRSGYVEPLAIERDVDLWRVRTVDPAGQKVTVFVNAEGEVLGASDVARTRIVETTTTTTTTRAMPEPVDERVVATTLVEAGFHNVHDIDYQGGVWKAEADDITGEDLEIHVDANSGLIVHVEDD
jgi:hypothetical protein